jgi:hypothetical protein
MSDLTLSTEEGKIDLSRPTETDLSAKQYFIVKHDAAELVELAGAADKALGILQNAPDGSTNQATAQVRIQGVSKVKAAAAITFGDYITADSSGEAVVAIAGQEYIGVALTSADNNDVFAVQLMKGIVDSDT